MALELDPKGLAVSSARRPFSEQIAFFRQKLGNLIPTERWTDVWKEAHDKGFMVAGAQKADLLADLAQAVDGAIADGQGIEWFRAQFDAIVARHGWSYRGERNWRTRVIYQTNISTSYAAGRLAQMRASGLPYWMYKHSDSVLHPRPLHVSWDGLTLPAGHPWFKTHAPPNGWGCKCRLVAVSRTTAGHLGGRIADAAPDDGVFPDGRPKGIDRGWDYMPGAAWNRFDSGGLLPDCGSTTDFAKGVCLGPSPRQKTWRDYGRPSIRDVPADLWVQAVGRGAPASSAEEALDLLAAAFQLSGEDPRAIVTPVERVMVSRGLLRHAAEDRLGRREMFAGLVPLTLERPYEVWNVLYPDGLRRRYIGLFEAEKRRGLVVIVRVNRDATIFWNVLRKDLREIDGQRLGGLVWPVDQGLGRQ